MTGTDPGLLAALLHAGAGDERRVRDTVERWGVRPVCSVLLDEILFRCDIPRDCGQVYIELVMVHGTERTCQVLRLCDGAPVEVAGPGPHEVGMRLEYQVTDLIRELYGPPSGRTAGQRATVLVPSLPPGSKPTRDGVRAIARATETVVAACSSNTLPDLARLALRHASDKWGGMHYFTPHYDRHFRALREQVVRVLEIGIGGYEDPGFGGGSLKMWKRYFPRGLVYGIDVFDKSHLDEPRITTLRGRQDDPDFLRGVVREHGPFDVVVDDGSHVNAHVRASFEVLFPYLRDGGFYVIEDLWTSYWPGYGGHRTPGGDPATTVELLKGLLDALHHEEHGGSAGAAAGHLVGLHLYHNVAFLEKGVNREGPIPAWIPRAPFWDDGGR